MKFHSALSGVLLFACGLGGLAVSQTIGPIPPQSVAVTCAQHPALTGDVTTSAGSCVTTLAAGSASNLNSGTLAAGRLPALTGDVTSSAGSAATTLAAGSASNLNSGTLAAARGGAGTINGALRGNGAGLVTQAACADISNAATYCSAALGQLPGINTNVAATAGNIGELVTASIAIAAETSLTTSTALSLTSISLTAGDWEVSGEVYFLPGASSSVTNMLGSISIVDNTLNLTVGRFSQWFQTTGVVFGNGGRNSMVIAPTQILIAGTVTVYLVAFSTFTVSTQSAAGIIRARRVH